MSTLILYVRIGFLVIVLLCFAGCSRKKVPLNEEKFTSLLIDLHRTDGTLSVAGNGGGNELKNYAYYNDVFNKYGITRADFDSCMYYYSARTALFNTMYDVVIDSLNKQLTAVDMVLRALKSNDSVNFFPVPDTLFFDDCCYTHILLEIDSLEPGLYKFSTNLQFDTLDQGKNNRITSFFLSGDNQDTLKVRDVNVLSDTLVHTYQWSQYIDSTYNRLMIKFVNSDNLDKLKGRKGHAWKMELFRPYISNKTESRLKQNLHNRR